jgi:ribosomal protein S1
MKSVTHTGGNFEFFYTSNEELKDTEATKEFKKSYKEWEEIRAKTLDIYNINKKVSLSYRLFDIWERFKDWFNGGLK